MKRTSRKGEVSVFIGVRDILPKLSCPEGVHLLLIGFSECNRPQPIEQDVFLLFEFDEGGAKITPLEEEMSKIRQK